MVRLRFLFLLRDHHRFGVFPSGNHTVAMLQTFGVFALSFVLRPIGALFWGNFGDKKGRKGALAISIMFMSGASF